MKILITDFIAGQVLEEIREVDGIIDAGLVHTTTVDYSTRQTRESSA
ncbi:MAG: hypothetical protein U9N09_05460 [Euryarchaeota archaeon]|nr:hypothetical protein [Euryarchaeota archaeon]